MKHNWEYKKLGDVCDIYQPKTISANMLVEDGSYLVYGANGVIGRYNQYNHKEKELLLTCRGATCGTINISEPFSWINGNAMVIHPIDKDIYLDFLKYQLRAIDLSCVITGAAQPQITRQSLSPLSIPVPPLPIQQQIVSELDKVKLIIENKKQQLKELDNLAQSIFYEMFGDPVENDKGWALCKWSDCLTIFNGKNQKQVESIDGKFPICGSGGLIGYANDYITPENSVIIGRKGNINKPIYMSVKFWNVDTAFGLHPKQNLLSRFLYYFCLLFDFERLNKAVTIPSLTKSDLLNIKMALPPLTLQQTFAQKIEAIEKQKELISQSIKEAETLFDSRMEYWFGE